MDDIIEDATYGEFDEFTSLRDLIESDSDFKGLLINETLSVWKIIWHILTKHPIWNLILFGLLFFGLKKSMGDNQRALFIAGATIAVLNFYEIISKIIHEGLI